jgi:hypothetical protein
MEGKKEENGLFVIHFNTENQAMMRKRIFGSEVYTKIQGPLIPSAGGRKANRPDARVRSKAKQQTSTKIGMAKNQTWLD